MDYKSSATSSPDDAGIPMPVPFVPFTLPEVGFIADVARQIVDPISAGPPKFGRARRGSMADNIINGVAQRHVQKVQQRLHCRRKFFVPVVAALSDAEQI